MYLTCLLLQYKSKGYKIFFNCKEKIHLLGYKIFIQTMKMSAQTQILFHTQNITNNGNIFGNINVLILAVMAYWKVLHFS